MLAIEYDLLGEGRWARPYIGYLSVDGNETPLTIMVEIWRTRLCESMSNTQLYVVNTHLFGHIARLTRRNGVGIQIGRLIILAVP